MMRTFGGWTVPRSEGLFGLTTPITIALFPYMGVLIFLPQFSLWLAGVWLLLGAMVLGGLFIKVEGRTLVEWSGLTMEFRAKKKKGATSYLSGPFSSIPGGAYTLPGVLSRFECFNGLTTGRQPFAMLHYPDKDEYTIVFRIWPQGTGVADTTTVNGWVDQWGAVLSSWGEDSDIVAATATVETFPSSGMRVRNEILRITDETSPALAQQIMVEAGQLQANQSLDMDCRLSITVKADTDAKRRDPGVAATDLARRIPIMLSRLSAAGLVAQAMNQEDLVLVIKRAYSSGSQIEMETGGASGEGHGLTFDQAGPAAAEETLTTYTHDGAVSSVWEMRTPPRGFVPQTVLSALMSKNDDVATKRVTVCYRPHSAAEAATLVDKDANNKLEKVKQERQYRKFARAKSEQDAAAANNARHAEAMGHGLTRFGLLITVTAPAPVLRTDGSTSELVLPNAEAVMKSLTSRARLAIRRRYASQQISFAAGLGIGVCIPEHLSGVALAQA